MPSVPPASVMCHSLPGTGLGTQNSEKIKLLFLTWRDLYPCSALHTGLLFQPRLCSWLLGLTNSSSSFNNSHLASCSHSPLTQMGKQASAGMFATLHCDVFTSPHPKERDCASFFSEFPVLDVELMRKLHWYLNERLT